MFIRIGVWNDVSQSAWPGSRRGLSLKKPVFVTEPHLPSFDGFVSALEQVWQSKRLTNGGPFHERLEREISEYLGVEHVCLFANGTLALIAALKSLGLEGEVITTPFSFAATTNAIRWAGLDPVFVDVEPETLNLDPERIDAAITDRTVAILPVHVYGNPCAVAAIDAIAHRRGLKVVYDAAHAFGVVPLRHGLFEYGDLSVLSFHATKVFNTLEGGLLFAVMRRPSKGWTV